MTPNNEQEKIETELVERVITSFEDTENPRLKQLLQSLTKHLHNFVREVSLTEDEWNTGIQFLTDVGHITDDKRQEFILLSDVLGISMQTINISNQTYKNATEATVFGPFFTEASPEIPLGGDSSGGASGEPSWVLGTVRDTDGNAIPNARIEVWEPMTTVFTTSNTPTDASPDEHTCIQMSTATTIFGV